MSHQKEDALVAVKTREAIGFVPWYFNLPDGGYEIAWKHLMDPKGFFAPFGPTTAERRDPTFMTREDNTPWDGQSWPFATTQTLVAMANLLNNYTQDIVSKKGRTKSALPLLCNRGRRFIAEASYGGLETKKALMNVGVVG
jgi:hypothetical protein